MAQKPTYVELEQWVKQLEQESIKRKLAETALIESEKWHRDFLDNLSDVVFESDNSGNVTYANKASVSLTGMAVEDIIGKPFLPLFDNKNQEIAVDVYQRTLNGESPQYELTFKNGRIASFKNKPLRSKDGNIIGLFGVARDITDRKKAEKELWESEVKHKALINNIPGMIYKAYPDWSAEVVSASEAICGYTEKELNSQENNWLSIIYHIDKDKVFRVGSELTRVKKDIVQEYRIKAKNGDIRWVEDRKTSNFSEDGAFLGIDGIVFDITERKRTQEALLQERDKLQKAIAEIKTLSGLLPICASCKKIRDDKGYWNQIESYICDHSDAVFSHGICPDCRKKLYPNLMVE